MEDISFASIPVLTGIVYLALWLYKYAANGKEKYIRLIPIIAAVLGAVLGVIGFYAAEGLIPADNVLTALLVGAATGLAATGTHQIFKQFTPTTDDNPKPDANSNQDGEKPDDEGK